MQAWDSGRLKYTAEKTPQIPTAHQVAAIGAQVCTRKDHFLVTLRVQLLNLCHHFGRGTAMGGAAQDAGDAEGTTVVTAVLDLDKGPGTERWFFTACRGASLQAGAGLTLARLALAGEASEEFRRPVLGRVAHHPGNSRQVLDIPRGTGGIASQGSDAGHRIAAVERPQQTTGLELGALRDGASVDRTHICLRGFLDKSMPRTHHLTC
jgi:hypothetical protein